MVDVNNDAAPDAEWPPTHVAALADVMRRLVHARITQQEWNGLRVSHFRLLTAVPPGGATVTELAGRLSMTKQAVGQFVTGLQASGHLDVRTDPADRRRRVVVRTPAGAATVTAVEAMIAALEGEWAEQVGGDRYAVFRSVLAEIAHLAAEP